MLYIIVILIFALSFFMLVFAKDGFINREMVVYDSLIQQPWLDRLVVLSSDQSLYD